MSMVNSLNLACSTAEPTMRISWRDKVICGDRSHGGVVSGDNLEPEPLNSLNNEDISVWLKVLMARAFNILLLNGLKKHEWFYVMNETHKNFNEISKKLNFFIWKEAKHDKFFWQGTKQAKIYASTNATKTTH